MSKPKARATAKASALPIPQHVAELWSEVQPKAAQQLFHADVKKRLEAVAALKSKYNFYAKRQTLLLAAALDEPDATVRAAMLDAMAETREYMSWQDTLRLRASVARLREDPERAVRLALARCMEAMPVPLTAEDLPWLQALANDPSLVSKERVVLGTLASSAIKQALATDTALALLRRLALHPTEGNDALVKLDELRGCRAVYPLLLELAETQGVASERVLWPLTLMAEGSADPRVMAVLEGHRPRELDALSLAMMRALVDRARLPETLASQQQAIAAALAQYPLHGPIVEALAWSPSHAALFVQRCAAPLLSAPRSVRLETIERWIRGNPERFASALAEQLSGGDGACYLRWWDQISPRTAGSDALRSIETVLSSRGKLSFSQERVCEAACALLVRLREVPPGTLATLALLGVRQLALLPSSTLPTVRAMHALGAQERDFAPIVEAYEREAQASDARAASDPNYDPATSRGAKLRHAAQALLALRDFASVRAHWEAFLHLWKQESELDHEWTLDMLEPWIAEAPVRALFEAALHRAPRVQRRAAQALGLLPRS